MANKLYNDTSIKAIADAIRTKNGKTDTYTVGEMAGAISSLAGGVEPQDKTYSQVNPVVAEYLANVTYNPDDYTTTQIDTYINQETSYDKSKPFGAEVTVKAGELVLNDKYSGLSVKKTVTAGTQKLVNITPSGGGNYSVEANGTVINCGELNPTGALRMIDCKAPNVRDLGGWACDGGTIRYGKLFRGGDLYESYKDELRAILCDQLGIRAELNLRGASEVTATSSVLGDDIIYCRPEQCVMYSIEDKTTWKEILRFVFDRIKYNQRLYYHCSAGADRTGTVSCILEAILGVDSSDRDKDYELTCFAGEGFIRKRTASYWIELINSINALTVGTTFRDKVINWVASMGFTVDEINAFRTAMIDGTPDTITLDIGTCSVTSNLSDSLSDNSETSLAKYQPYSAVIVPKGGKVIKNITVTMGGVDVTKKYVTKIFQPNGEINIDAEGRYNVSKYSAAKVEFPNYSITQTLGEATNNNTADAVTKNKSYGAIIKSNNGFKIKNITVTMGGVDVTANVTVGVEV